MYAKSFRTKAFLLKAALSALRFFSSSDPCTRLLLFKTKRSCPELLIPSLQRPRTGRPVYFCEARMRPCSSATSRLSHLVRSFRFDPSSGQIPSCNLIDIPKDMVNIARAIIWNLVATWICFLPSFCWGWWDTLRLRQKRTRILSFRLSLPFESRISWGFQNAEHCPNDPTESYWSQIVAHIRRTRGFRPYLKLLYKFSSFSCSP